jgi:hypothetical protein
MPTITFSFSTFITEDNLTGEKKEQLVFFFLDLPSPFDTKKKIIIIIESQEQHRRSITQLFTTFAILRRGKQNV